MDDEGGVMVLLGRDGAGLNELGARLYSVSCVDNIPRLLSNQCDFGYMH